MFGVSGPMSHLGTVGHKGGERVSTPENAIRLLEEICDQGDRARISRHAYFTLRSIAPQLATTALVQDVIGDTFLTACEIIRSRPERLPATRAEMLAWLRRIILFKCLESARRRRISREVQLRPESEALYVEHPTVDILDSGDHRETLSKAYEALTDDEKGIMQLYLNDSMTSTTIANRLGLEPAAVRKVKQRAIEKLRRYLQRAGA